MGAVLAGVGVLAWLTALTVYDLVQRRLPNVLTVPGAVVVLSAAILSGRGWPALLGALALTGLYLAVHLAAPSAMGAGDVKLAVGIGALTGAFGVDVWIFAAISAPLLTGLWGLMAGASGVLTVPHGPSMCIAASAALAPVLG